MIEKEWKDEWKIFTVAFLLKENVLILKCLNCFLVGILREKGEERLSSPNNDTRRSLESFYCYLK